jgi:glycolate oxidase
MHATLLAAIASIKPPPLVVADDEGLRPFETDAYISRRATPLVAVLPEREEQVREVLRACRRLHVPVVTRGAGTGISGGAIPLPDGVLLVMTRMRGIKSLDAEACQAMV